MKDANNEDNALYSLINSIYDQLHPYGKARNDAISKSGGMKVKKRNWYTVVANSIIGSFARDVS